MKRFFVLFPFVLIVSAIFSVSAFAVSMPDPSSGSVVVTLAHGGGGASPGTPSDPRPSGDEDSSMGVVSSVGEVFTAGMGWVAAVAQSVAATPVLLLFVLLPLISLGVILFKRLLFA